MNRKLHQFKRARVSVAVSEEGNERMFEWLMELPVECDEGFIPTFGYEGNAVPAEDIISYILETDVENGEEDEEKYLEGSLQRFNEFINQTPYLSQMELLFALMSFARCHRQLQLMRWARDQLQDEAGPEAWDNP